MRKFKFSKLVRDRIVEHIVASGNKPEWRVLDTDEYVFELKKKLAEEASELTDASQNEVVKELADIQEIIDNLLEVLQVSREELMQAQVEKNKKNGSFKMRHHIDVVEVKDDAPEIEYYLQYSEKYPEIK